jgi:alkanesulfonate monooxygenase SsuD/methylene tetrahydromethanopterin reductase-like flavin-dependent oxidoreductase (luciferase family)
MAMGNSAGDKMNALAEDTPIRAPHSAIRFGWIPAVSAGARTQNIPIVIGQQAEILPVVAEHFDSLWVYDHFYGLDKPQRPWLECWTTLTWLAARFPTLGVGSVVLGVGYRNPALLAKMAATLQAFSGGRLVLGIGAGWREEEHRAYGYPFPGAQARRDELDEALEIIRRMWTEEAPTFHGTHFQITDAYCPPRPDPVPPIMIGSFGERILPLIARRADWWDVWSWSLDAIDPESYRAKRDLLDEHARELGRDPATIIRSLSMSGGVLPASAEDSARWVARLRPFVALGVTRFMIDFGFVPAPDPIRRFAAEVIAPLNAG